MTLSKDQDHLANLRNGSTQVLNEIFVEHHAKLCTIAYRVLRDQDAAKDVVQQVFLKIWEKRTSLDITSSIEAYLKRAVFNTSLNTLEKQKRTRINPGENIIQSIGDDVSDLHTYNELELRAKAAIDKLPPRTRAVFTLIRTEDMSYKEVAESLSISIKAVEKEMMKALRILREMLQEYLPLVLIMLSIK